MNREHDAAPKPVVASTGIVTLVIGLDDGETGFFQVFLVVAARFGRFQQIVPAIERVAQLKLLDGGQVQPALLEVAVANAHALLRVQQQAVEMVFGVVRNDELGVALVLFQLLLGRFFLFLNGDSVLLGQVFQGLHVAGAFHVHHELHHAAGLAAAKALIKRLGRVY